MLHNGFESIISVYVRDGGQNVFFILYKVLYKA